MFPSFKQITFAQCCEAAEEVRIKYWNSETIPVDVDHIIENGLRLTVIPVDGLRNDRDIYGFLSNCRSYVFVDSDVMITPKFEATLRFTMAHELGHYFLHREFYEAHAFTNVDGWKDLLRQIGGPNLIAYENQADEFAGRLLIPINHLRSELNLMEEMLAEIEKLVVPAYGKDGYQNILPNVLADNLAPKFNVPFETMLQRLKREDLKQLSSIISRSE